MHGSFDGPRKTLKSAYRNWGVGIFALPLLIAAALVGLAVTNPVASNWIAQAVQAEFANSTLPEMTPIQLAQPAKAIRAAKAN